MTQSRMLEYALHKSGFGPVAGVDEAGRGACAGPIVIASCVLPERRVAELDKLADSKKLSAAARERLFPIIKDCAVAYCVTTISAGDIDAYGIQYANISGMRRSIAGLEERPRYVLTDAMKVPGIAVPYLPVIGGDDACRCIAAASVLAKVTRDRIMVDLAERYPGYGFASHKGYGTRAHMEKVAELGACREHRLSYANVQAAIFEGKETRST